MEILFTILLTPIRAGFALWVIASVSTVVVEDISSAQPFSDPFTPYAETLLGRLWENVSQWGFDCRFNVVQYAEEICSLTPESELFSEIQVQVATNSSQVSRMVFTLHENMLTIGQLVILWGQPKVVVLGQTTIFRWPHIYAIALTQTNHKHFSYWQPVKNVTFEAVG